MNILVPFSDRERKEWEAKIRKARFLDFQVKWLNDRSKAKLAEKSRQLGFSWIDSYDSVRETAGKDWPFDCWISSRDQVQAQLYAQDAHMWAGVLQAAAGDLGEAVLETERGERVSATRLPFANGRAIYSLSSNVDAQAGKRGTRKLDEFALNKENRRLMGIARPGTQWGGRLVIFSTHRGSENFFNKLVIEAKHEGNKKGFSLHTVTIEDALRDGLLVKLKESWKKIDPEDERLQWDEDDFLQVTRDGCPDDETFLEEYMCQPSHDDSAFLTYDLIIQCCYTADDGEWAIDLRKCGPLYVGVDVGRDHDLTVIWVMEKINGIFFTRRVIEMKAQTFAAQRNTLFPILELRNVQRCCIDATGIGRNLAEDARLQFGWKVEEVTFTPAVKEELAYPCKAAFEDRIVRIPDTRPINADLRAIKKSVTASGNIRFAADRGKNGHSDRFWALALALHAGLNTADPGEFRRFMRSIVETGNSPRQIRRRRRECIG
jgi:phage FluMu gp28-like protein